MKNIFKPNGYWFFNPRSGLIGGLMTAALAAGTAVGILALAITTAHADSLTKRTPALPTDAEYQAVTDQIVARQIEAQGWCRRAKPAAKSGQVVVYYVRDKSGKCVATFTQGK